MRVPSRPLTVRAGRPGIGAVVIRTWSRMLDNQLMDRAAAIAFYAMTALVPFLAVLLALAVRVLPDLGDTSDTGLGILTSQEFDTLLHRAFPPEAYTVVRDQIVRLRDEPPVELLSFGVAISLWLASSSFLVVVECLNVIHVVKETRPFWKVRLIALAVKLLQAVILLGVVTVMAVWPPVLAWLGLAATTAFLATLVQGLVVWLALLFLFALNF